MPHTDEQRTERFAFGKAILDEVDGQAGERVIESLSTIAPELGHQIVSWGFGEMYSRPALVPQQRQLVTLGILTALGGCESQLDVHINASLNVGLTPDEIIETFLHASVYCGFPRALNAVNIAKSVFAARGVSPESSQAIQPTNPQHQSRSN